MTMLYGREMEGPEVAEALGISAQTVRSLHHKALQRLRAHFLGEGEEKEGDDSPGGGVEHRKDAKNDTR